MENKELKHTKEPLEKVYVSNILMVLNTILPDTDEEYEQQKETIEANCQLWKTSSEMLEMLIEVEKHHQGYHSEIGRKIRDVIKKATEK